MNPFGRKRKKEQRPSRCHCGNQLDLGTYADREPPGQIETPLTAPCRPPPVPYPPSLPFQICLRLFILYYTTERLPFSFRLSQEKKEILKRTPEPRESNESITRNSK